jgi:hypothetical protein
VLNIKNIGFIVLLGLSIQLSAQSVIQIEKRAFQAFKLAQYSTAKVDFQQLLARDPESDSYNFHYAVCVFHTENKQHAKKYFEFVANRSVAFCEAHYYLGKIHHLGYRFDLAISSFKAYLSCNPADYLHANREISFCNNGKSLLEHPKSLSTLGVQLASEENFIQKYDLEAIGGTIYPDPSLQTKIDKKKNYIPTCYYKRGDTFKFYASYGDEATSLKLFYIQRISQDVWSKPTAIPLVLPDSELKYPFFDAASKQLYFSSNGFTSMGGYDLFRVSYDPALNEVGTPENMDFPFSSAADDYFFVPLNATATTAWFASNRNTATGAIEAMQVSYTINAQPLVAIVGDFSDFVDPKNKGIQISVTDKADGVTYGPFTSDELGSYKLMLPGAGTYVFNATIEGTDKVFQHEQKIPQQKENVVFKQTINYSMNQGTESADFSHEFNAVQSEEMKAFKANAIAQLSLKAHSKPLAVDVVEPMNTENTVVQQLESLSIKGNTLLEKSEYLMDKLLEISNTGFDLSDAADRNKNQINSTNARLEAYQKQADMYKKLLSTTDTVANQRFAAALMKLNDSIQKYELELASWSLSERENQVKLSTWNTLNVEPSITSLSERIHMALIQENQDSLIAVLQRNSNSINQFITYSANLENTSIPIIASNEPLLEELKQLEATEKQLSQQIAQIEQQKITANRKELGALNTDQDAKEQMLNSTRLVIASKMGDIARNDIVNALKINGHEPTDSIVEQLLDRTTARKTEQTSLQRVVSAQSSNTTSLDHQRSIMQAETTVIQNQMLLASPIEKEALANKLQELEASLDSINTEMLALANTKITNPVQSNKAAPATNTTNPVTNERTANDVAVNPAETNTTAPGTNTTNPVTNERKANDVAANPAETNPTAPVKNTTNPVTNERTANDITANPAETNTNAPGTNTTNPVTNERTANDVAVNPAETNSTAPATNTTNPVTNERTANDVAVNPAETNPTAPATNTTNPVTNERTTNDVTANPAETNTTAPGTKTTNPVTNERTANDVAVNPAETNTTAPGTNTTNPINNERTANDVAVNPTETTTTALGTNTTNPVTNERTANDVAVNTAETTTTALGTNTTNPVTSERTANDVAVNPTETTTTALGTNTTNPVTNERTANDVAVNPAETNTTEPGTNTTNPVTNERRANDVAVNPAETNTTAPGKNTTNPVTNERRANDVAVNPAETNTTEPATNTTNPVTNERTANDVAVNPAESVAVPVQRLKTEEQQKTENAINEVQELQTALSSLQPEQDGLDDSMSLLKNQLRIAKVLLALKTTYGDSTYALIIGAKQGEMLAEALSGSIADLSEISQFETQFSDNAAEIITNGLVVKGLPVKTQPFTPNPLLELTPQQRTKLGSDKSYDDYISLRKEFVSLASKRNEIEIQLAQKRVALFRAVDDGAIEAISEEMVELANTLNMLEAQELRILSRIERMEDREAYHVLASQGIAPSQNLVYAPLDAQSLNFTLNVDKKQGNRYPILSTLPEGLIFRIQVGVFRNAVPDYFFREFSPVSGERLTEELTAYLTGFFVNSVQANDARGQVQGLGYTDAFVVAYCDGKRIPIKQALEYEKKGLCTIRNQGEVLREASALLNSKEESIPSTVNIPKEVYYTIQVAALKNQDNGKLKNVPALFYIQSKTGLYKYNSGKFKQLNEAKQQRDALKTLGYTDAYIVAYRDGIAVNFKEIEIALAYEQESENRASPTKIAVNTDLSGIELIDSKNVFYAFSKSVDTLLLEQMNAYNRMEAFVYTPDVLRSAPLDANDISPLLAIYYSDFTLSEVNPERVEKMSIQDNSNTFPMVHDFAIRNQIPFRVSYSNEARPYIDFYPVSEANRESIRKLAEALSLNVILN